MSDGQDERKSLMLSRIGLFHQQHLFYPPLKSCDKMIKLGQYVFLECFCSEIIRNRNFYSFSQM